MQRKRHNPEQIVGPLSRRRLCCNDRWVQQRGAPVEVEKHDLERGAKLRPDLYGLAAGVGHE